MASQQELQAKLTQLTKEYAMVNQAICQAQFVIRNSGDAQQVNAAKAKVLRLKETQKSIDKEDRAITRQLKKLAK